ncbi:hypothetical protein D9M68_887750 [compost metagenome]
MGAADLVAQHEAQDHQVEKGRGAEAQRQADEMNHANPALEKGRVAQKICNIQNSS